MKQLAVFAVWMIACSRPAPTRSQATPESLDELPLFDHHAHIFDAPVRHRLETELDLKPLPSRDAGELLTLVRGERVVKSAILSNAYFFANSTAKQPGNPQLFTAENDHVADVVARNPDRFVGFFSVNPIADSALPEIERCARSKGFVGMKLHLANSGVDLRNPTHVQLLAAVFKKANALRLPIVIHMRTMRPDYGREDAQIFIDQVLSLAPDVPVQIAHLAGWGGYDVPTDSAFGAFIERAARVAPASDHVYFDISAVIRGEPANAVDPGGAWFPSKRYARLTDQLRKLGLQRVWFGTDWPDWTPRSYVKDLEHETLLTPAELRVLLTNRAPWFQ